MKDVLLDQGCAILDGECTCPRFADNELPECRKYTEKKTMKPHRGVFKDCRKVFATGPTEGTLGFYLVGIFDDNDDRLSSRGEGTFSGSNGYTSLVVKVDGPEVETLNSRYTIVNCYNSDDFK